MHIMQVSSSWGGGSKVAIFVLDPLDRTMFVVRTMYVCVTVQIRAKELYSRRECRMMFIGLHVALLASFTRIRG